MRTHRFYDKSFEDPCIRWARYWNLPEYFVRHLFKDIFEGGRAGIEIRTFVKQTRDIDISRRSLDKFIQACKIYWKIKDTKLKKGASVTKEFFEIQRNLY